MKPYTAKVLQAYQNIKHSGAFVDLTDVITLTAGSVSAGEVMQLQLKLSANKIEGIRFKVFGCGYAIACLSFTAEYLLGKDLTSLKDLSAQMLIDEFALPEVKYHSAYLVEELIVQGSINLCAGSVVA